MLYTYLIYFINTIRSVTILFLTEIMLYHSIKINKIYKEILPKLEDILNTHQEMVNEKSFNIINYNKYIKQM